MTTITGTLPTIKTQLGVFSLATRTTTKRGKWLCDDYFDVLPTSDTHHTADIEAFRELMVLIKSAPSTGVLVRDVIHDAALKMDDVEVDGKTRRWVAYGFMNMIDDAVRFFAKNANWEPWLQARIESNQKYKERSQQEQRERMATLTRLSVEARQKRKKAKAQDALCA